MRALPGDGGAEVWTVDLDLPIDTSCLSADEVARAARFHQEIHRRRFAAGRAALRSILAQYVGASPAAVLFIYGPQGKPSLVESHIHFNLAHTGRVALIAVAATSVGIDVERIASDIEPEAIGEVAFVPDEIAALRAISPDRRALAFAKVWTSREALAKGLGLGLSMSPGRITVCADPALPPRLLRGCAGWQLERLAAPPGHIATLAIATDAGRTVQRHWP